ncbi:MAG: ATP synthase F1 subunit gamma [Leptospirales bacterium]|nr:ATP synthase F1 subunit gamma [Leptospirales bacterium]
MATKRDIKNRIKSVTSTKKITSTMEMVAGSKMKKMQQRLSMLKPYEEKVNQIMANIIAHGGAALEDPLLKEADNPRKALVFHITGNRGLCGSYNSQSIEKTLKFKAELESAGREVHLYAVGKKGINYYTFSSIAMWKNLPNLEDKFTFDEAAKMGLELTKLFLDGAFDEVYVSYTKIFSPSSQKPANFRLLPISIELDEGNKTLKEVDYIFDPGKGQIFSYLLPLYLKVKIFSCFLESGFSEQFARRVAMKNATDASEEMIRNLRITYNRVRQAKITSEIAEIVGGAAALE